LQAAGSRDSAACLGVESAPVESSDYLEPDECSADRACQAAASAWAELSAASRHPDYHRLAVSHLPDSRRLAVFLRLDFRHLVVCRRPDFPDSACPADTGDARCLEDWADAHRLVACRHSEVDDNPGDDRRLGADDSRAGDSTADARKTDNQGDMGGNSRHASKGCRNKRCDCR